MTCLKILKLRKGIKINVKRSQIETPKTDLTKINERENSDERVMS